MKKTLFTFMLASILALAAQSQPLQNTWWRDYDISDTPGFYWNFRTDSIYFSLDNLVYDSIAVYTATVNVIAFIDIIASGCPMSDTGLFNFSILNDTLRFTYISDQCLSRANFYTTHYFVRLTTAADDIHSISTANIYPNPSSDGIFNLMFNENGSLPKRIYIISADGRKIMEENFSSAEKNHTINLQSRAPGIYFLVMENEKGRRVEKLVR